MRQSRIYTSQTLAVTEKTTLEGPAAHYLSRVLRLSVGDLVTLFNGDGNDYAGEIIEFRREEVIVQLSDSCVPGNESPLKVTLVQAVSRGERMDYCLQKATELGVHCIQPLLTSRVEVRLDKKRQIKRLAHWRAVVISACEQSGRAVVPGVSEPLLLGDWLAAERDTQCLVLDPEAENKLTACHVDKGFVSILVGPEGGFAMEELELMQANGVRAVSLGPRVLRTESAGPAAITVLQTIAGDL